MIPDRDAAVGFAGGKVILLGEHAVVHGAPALAIGIPLGVEVAATRRPGPVSVRVSSWGLDASVGDGTPVGAAMLALLGELGLETNGVLLVGESRIPPRAGLGSSAALVAAIARALAALHGLELDRKRLFAAVQASERVFHGNPSGLDAATAILGGSLRFERAQGPTALRAEPPQLVVAHCGTEGRTRETVAAFARWLDAHPDEGETRLARIAALTESGIAALERGDLPQLGQAMNECHEHLAWFGVSTAELDRVCEVARAAGALGAKLTGGGGGGCAVALPAPGETNQVADAIADAGFEVVLG